MKNTTLAALVAIALAGVPLASTAADNAKPTESGSAAPAKDEPAAKQHSHMQERIGAGSETKKPSKPAKKASKEMHQHQRDMK